VAIGVAVGGISEVGLRISAVVGVGCEGLSTRSMLHARLDSSMSEKITGRIVFLFICMAL